MAIDQKLLGKSIRQVRELRGVSQTALAKEAGMKGNSVALIERGERGVSIETLNALAKALDIPAACLTMLGTSDIAGEASSKSLVKSMQELILATLLAHARLRAKEEAEEAKQRQIEEAMRAIPGIESLMQSGAAVGARAARPKANVSKKKSEKRKRAKKPEHV